MTETDPAGDPGLRQVGPTDLDGVAATREIVARYLAEDTARAPHRLDETTDPGKPVVA